MLFNILYKYRVLWYNESQNGGTEGTNVRVMLKKQQRSHKNRHISKPKLKAGRRRAEQDGNRKEGGKKKDSVSAQRPFQIMAPVTRVLTTWCWKVESAVWGQSPQEEQDATIHKGVWTSTAWGSDSPPVREREYNATYWNVRHINSLNKRAKAKHSKKPTSYFTEVP